MVDLSRAHISVQFIALIFFIVFWTLPVLSQETIKKQAKSKGSAWAVNCSNSGKGLVCKVMQRLVLKKTNQLLLAVTVQKSDQSDKASMLIQLPHGLFLPAGVKLQIDNDKQTNHTIQTCDQRGCYVGLPLAASVLKSMSSGKMFAVIFQNLKKKNVKVPLPLKGFEAAYKKL